MAESPSHKFGQIIGNMLEQTIEPFLVTFAKKNGLYLDKIGKRKARKGKKVTWIDSEKNKHDLDFVLERNGTENKIGSPVAFIESAWRRYTKHSRNKSQEIEGALLHLSHTFEKNAPFLGAILAGEFTVGAINQLNSHGFEVLYFSYQSTVKAFQKVGIDASSTESTPDSEFAKKVQQWNKLSQTKQLKISQELQRIEARKIKKFTRALTKSVNRKISKIRILPLHGSLKKLSSINLAIKFINNYDEKFLPTKFERYEIEIQYNNGDKISGEFQSRSRAIGFLNSFK